MPVKLAGKGHGSDHLPRNQHNSVLRKGPSLLSIVRASTREQEMDFRREDGKTPVNATAQNTGKTQPEHPSGIYSSVIQDDPCACSQKMVPVPNPSERVQFKKEGDRRKHSGVPQIFESEGNVILHNEKTHIGGLSLKNTEKLAIKFSFDFVHR